MDSSELQNGVVPLNKPPCEETSILSEFLQHYHIINPVASERLLVVRSEKQSEIACKHNEHERTSGNTKDQHKKSSSVSDPANTRTLNQLLSTFKIASFVLLSDPTCDLCE